MANSDSRCEMWAPAQKKHGPQITTRWHELLAKEEQKRHERFHNQKR